MTPVRWCVVSSPAQASEGVDNGTQLDLAVGPARQVMMLLTILTTLALVLGAVGVYGVISHFVNRRSRDWGVRIALGMMPDEGRGHDRHAWRHARLVRCRDRHRGRSSRSRVSSARCCTESVQGIRSPWPAATVVLFIVGVTAATIPGLRASRTDPAIVLREQ